MKKLLLKTSWIALCLLTLIACKKDSPEGKEHDGGEKPIIDETTFLSRESGLPGQVFQLTTSNSLTADHYTLQIGTETVNASRMDTHTLVFIMPYIPSGEYFIDLKTIHSTLGQLPIKVDRYTPIENIEQAYKQVIAWMEDDNAPVLDQEIEDLIQQRFKEEFDKLTDGQKKAQLFQIKSLLEQVENEIAALKNSLLTATNTVNDRSANIKKMSGIRLQSSSRPYRNTRIQEINQHATNILAAAMTIGTIGGVGAFVTWASGPAAPLVGSFYTIIMVKQVRRMLGIMWDSAVAIKDVVGVAVSDAFSFRASNTRQKASTSNSSSTSTGHSLVFIKDNPQEVDIAFTFGSVALELESFIQGGFFDTFFTAYNKFTNLYTPLYSGQQKIQELLKTDKQVLPPPSDFLATDMVREDMSVEAEEIRITNISPAELDIQITQGENGILFTASSTTITDSIGISFDVVYTQEDFGHTVTKTVNASYDGREQQLLLEIASGNLQTGIQGSKLQAPLVIKVTNQKGEPVVNAKVRWRVVNGSGQVVSHADTTDRSGSASADWTLGVSGDQEVIAELVNGQSETISEVRFTAKIQEGESLFSDAAAIRAILAANNLSVSDSRWTSGKESDVIAVMKANATVHINNDRVTYLWFDNSNRKISIFPSEIGNLTELKSLGTGYGANQLSSISPEIGKLTKLENLYILVGVNLPSIPKEIGNLSNLKNLRIASTANSASNLPAEIGKLVNLKELTLHMYSLTRLPSEIGHLRNLTRLEINSTLITNVPPEIGNLSNLDPYGLFIINNPQLTTIPAELAKLSNLRQLSLSYNNLTSIPAAIATMNVSLSISNNKNLLCLPKAIWDSPTINRRISTSGTGISGYGDTDCSQ